MKKNSEESDNLITQYGLDIIDELSKMFSEQIAKEIDKDVLRSLGIEPDRNKRRINSINKIFKNVRSSKS